MNLGTLFSAFSLSVLALSLVACAPPPAKSKVSGGNCSAEIIEHINRLTTQAYSLMDANVGSGNETFASECRSIAKLMTGEENCRALDQRNEVRTVSISEIERFCAYEPDVFLAADGTRLSYKLLSMTR